MLHTFRRLALLTLLAGIGLPIAARADSASLMSQAQRNNPVRYSFAQTKKAEIRATSDNRAFTVWWQPSSTSTAKPPKGVIVALHGHDSWATDEMYLWQPYAEKYGYGLLALQWWFGAGETTADYYTPEQMYPLISQLLVDKGITPGTVLFMGYSRGSANSYAVAALDNSSSGKHQFGLVLSNSGGAMSNYPPNQQISAGVYGKTPFAGIKWAMYCGEKDPDPNTSGCPAMQASKTWVTQLGAEVILFIDDPTGDHGGFMTNGSGANVEKALAAFAGVLATPVQSNVLSNTEANCLFDWAEKTYPSALNPAHATSLSSAPYYYRHYTVSSSYVGVSSADNRLYYVDASGSLRDMGMAATWSAQAGCR